MHYFLTLILALVTPPPVGDGWYQAIPIPDTPDTPTLTPSVVDLSTVELEHGHLVDLDVWIDSDGRRWTSKDAAFLAVKVPLELVPETLNAMDYLQEIPYFRGVKYKDGIAVHRSEVTTQITPDGWLILPVEKPCGPTHYTVSAGLITVCPPRVPTAEGATPLHACTWMADVPPVYRGTPPEKIRCAHRRRGARH